MIIWVYVVTVTLVAVPTVYCFIYLIVDAYTEMYWHISSLIMELRSRRHPEGELERLLRLAQDRYR